MQRRILSALIERYPNGVHLEALADVVWGDDPNGGPTSAASNISVNVHTLRKKLAPVGWGIKSPQRGSNSVGIRLWPLEAA